jgi:hypothetical protein
MKISEVIFPLLGLAFICFVAGMHAGIHFADVHPPIIELKRQFAQSTCSGTPDEDGYRCRFKIQEPKNILLRFVSTKDFEAQRPTPDTVAFAEPYNEPCEIVLPVGARIDSTPATGEAHWGYDSDSFSEIAQTIAHEILHCYTGSWHPGPHLLAWTSLVSTTRWYMKFRHDHPNLGLPRIALPWWVRFQFPAAGSSGITFTITGN